MTTQTKTTSPEEMSKMLRLKQSAEFLGVSEPTLWRLDQNDPTFPKKIRISSRCCGYRIGDLIEWQQSRMGGAA